MIVVKFPFDMEDPNMKQGFELGKNPNYQPIKPVSDAELMDLVGDFLEEGKHRLAHNLGFLFGLFDTSEENTVIDHLADL